MSVLTREIVDVPDEFWDAYDGDDLDEAGRILGETLQRGSHRAAKDGCDDSFFGRHLYKYASEDATVSDDSTEIRDIAWDDKTPTGTIYGSFGEYIHRGCRDMSYQGDPSFDLRFGVETRANRRHVWVEVLSDRPYFSHE